MATWVSLHDATFMRGREKQRDVAFNSMGLYFEHDWTADGPISRDARAAWQRRTAGQIEQYVDTLYADASARLAGLVPNPDGRPLLLVFNSLGWDRTDIIDAPAPSPEYIGVIDRSTGNAVRAQRLSDGRIRFAAEVPSLGYRIFELTKHASPEQAPTSRPAAGHFSNGVYSLDISAQGDIEHLFDELHDHREIAGNIDHSHVNGAGANAATIEFTDAGPVSTAVRVCFDTRPPRTSTITLYHRGPRERIDIVDEINGNFGGTCTWDFAFKLNDLLVRHEEVGAIARVGRQKDGGFYADRNARTDYLTMGHFVELSQRDGYGVTLSNADSAFFRLGHNDVDTLDTSVPLVQAVVGMQVDGLKLGIPNQGGDTHFINHYALRTHAGPVSSARAMQFALEHQNPLIAIPVGRNAGAGPLTRSSAALLHAADPGTIVWTVKPAEVDPGRNIIVRVWNLSDEPGGAPLRLKVDAAEPLKAMRTTHIETDLEPANMEGNVLLDTLPSQRMQTYRLTVKAP